MDDYKLIPPATSAPILLEQPTDEEGVIETVRKMDIREFRELGLVHEINRLLLHPLGMALEVALDPATGEESLSGVWDCREDQEGVLYADETLNAVKAERVAHLMEQRGERRGAVLGYVIQPVDPDASQLTVRIKEPVTSRIAPPGEYDEGEETILERLDERAEDCEIEPS